MFGRVVVLGTQMDVKALSGTEPGRIPSLDGLRAIAILTVCLAHFGAMKDTPFPHFTSIGNLGVRVFFVISGMLITRLLLNERSRNGAISLKNFYIRRSLRIFPAMWCYVAVIAALWAVGIVSTTRTDILHSLTYTINYLPPPRSWYFGHIWSLSVEEQFYLVWPAIVAITTRRQATLVVMTAIAVAPLLRILAWLTLPGGPQGTSEWFPTTCDAIATGCLLALLPAADLRRATSPWICSKWFILVPVLVVALDSLPHHIDTNHHRAIAVLLDSFGLTIINTGIGLVVERVVTYPGDWAGWFLNSNPLMWLGRVSYSVYAAADAHS